MPSAAVNVLLEELQYLIGTVSVPVTQKTITQFLVDHNCQVDGSLVKELATELCTSHPIKLAIGKDGPLSTAWRSNKYYRSNFFVVEPVEYVIDQKNRRSFQYIPILKTLQQVLNCETILSNAFNLKGLKIRMPQQSKPGSINSEVCRLIQPSGRNALGTPLIDPF